MEEQLSFDVPGEAAPGFLSGLGDDLGAGLVRAVDQLVDTGLGPGTQAEDALAVSSPSDLVVADDPAEATGGNQHQADAVIERANRNGSGTPSSAGSPMASRPRPSR
jgi:hypothetical protein